MKSEKSSQIRQEIWILLRRNHVISWNKELSAHRLSEICEIKLLTKHFSLPHIYFVVCKRQWTYTPCNKIADEKQNKEKKNKLGPPSKKIPLSLQHSYTCFNTLLFILLSNLFQESTFWSSCNRCVTVVFYCAVLFFCCSVGIPLPYHCSTIRWYSDCSAGVSCSAVPGFIKCSLILFNIVGKYKIFGFSYKQFRRMNDVLNAF